jgi:hypothetical protein
MISGPSFLSDGILADNFSSGSNPDPDSRQIFIESSQILSIIAKITYFFSITITFFNTMYVSRYFVRKFNFSQKYEGGFGFWLGFGYKGQSETVNFPASDA